MPAIPLIVEPDPDDPGCASLFVDGTISGRPCRFLLDTGASRTQVLTIDMAGAPTRDAPDTSSGVFEARPQRLATIEHLAIGSIRVPSLEVTVVDPSEPHAQALLGMDVLRSTVLDLRLREGTVAFDEPNDGAGQPLRLGPHGHPYADVRWGEVVASGVVDTGASMTIVDRPFAERHPQLFEQVGSSVGTDSSGTSMDTPTVTIASPLIADVRLPPHRGAVVDLSAINATLEEPMDLIVGYTTLAHGDWTFDFPNARWACVPARGSRGDI
jgi:predicted aspartyl protease